MPLPRLLAAELADHIADFEADDLVFTTASGSVVRSANCRQGVFLPLRKRAGISDRFRVHDLRHTAAALMKRRRVASDATFRAWREDGAVRAGVADQRAGQFRRLRDERVVIGVSDGGRGCVTLRPYEKGGAGLVGHTDFSTPFRPVAACRKSRSGPS